MRVRVKINILIAEMPDQHVRYAFIKMNNSERKISSNNGKLDEKINVEVLPNARRKT